MSPIINWLSFKQLWQVVVLKHRHQLMLSMRLLEQQIITDTYNLQQYNDNYFFLIFLDATLENFFCVCFGICHY